MLFRDIIIKAECQADSITLSSGKYTNLELSDTQKFEIEDENKAFILHTIKITPDNICQELEYRLCEPVCKTDCGWK